MTEGRILTDSDLKNLSKLNHVHRDTDIVLESTGYTLENELMIINTVSDTLSDDITNLENKKISFAGQNPAKNIQIIEKGGSTADIPNTTLIFELE